MIYETEPEPINKNYQDSRFATASHYLKAMRWNDVPTELMPKDAVMIRHAKRFYSGLTMPDREIIDSFSDYAILKTLTIRKRNQRFSELVYLFMQSMGMSILLPPALQQAEKGLE